MNASRSSANGESETNKHAHNVSELDLFFDESVLQLIDEPFEPRINSSKLRTDIKYNGFDSTMGNTWIYPTNYPVRQYQHNISRVSLFKNTLVVLPTGLGKTFIASVVMYNVFRWYPKGKIIFMAPTRPLVAQQIDACYQIMGFPKDETIELTGRQNKKIRANAWLTKRVFYCTPQVVWSDMNDNEIDFPINDVKLIVVDEAHKAKGKYAYTEVVQSLSSRNKLFRVLALSATPGRSIKDVCEVIQNLLIANIEVRRESSIDVAPYVFKKNIKTIVVQLDDRLKQMRKRLHDLVEPYVQNLIDQQVIGGNNGNLTKAWLLFDRNKFRESTLTNRHPEQSNINCDFSVCISMYHAIELLERHGMRVFLNYFNENNPDGSAEEKFFVMKDTKIRQFINEVRNDSGIMPFTDENMSFYGNIPNIDEEPINYGHPKFQILQKCLVDHFQEFSDTKAIVFCEYRESVFLINRMLLANSTSIKPKVFVGQGSSHNRTITQKEQIAIMNDFRSGKCNTLIATCVAEEGIDVGEVDFIVCFDVNNKNPIRFVQRIGRTGRKRQGKVTMLVTEGKEQQILKEILATKDGINQKIAKSNEIKTLLYKDCPRLIPPEFNPQCVETFIDIKNTQEPSTIKTKKTTNAKATKQKAKSPKPNVPRKAADMRRFFKPIEIDDEIEENFDLSSYGNTSTDHNDKSKNSCNTTTDSQFQKEQRNESVSFNAQDKELSKSCDDVPLEVKFHKVYNRYCDIRKAQTKWNGFSEKISKTAINNDRLPDILKNALVKYTNESNNNRVFRTNPDAWSSCSTENKLKLISLMSLLHHKKINSIAVNKSQKSSEAPGNQKENSETDKQSNTLDDSQMWSMMQTQSRSKYVSQLNVPCETKMYKPPLAIHQIACSTPHKMSNGKSAPSAPIHSPIASSPIMSSFKQPHPMIHRHRADKTDPRWHLTFLGLSTVFDLFSDDVEQMTENTNDINNKSEEQQAKFCDNLNKSVCGNDSLIEEESQYTVSRILNICENAENQKTNDNKIANNSSIRRRRLYIGSVKDLFCEDDENDEDEDDDVIINTKTIGTSLSGSDDTIDYNVADAMEQQRNLNNSTNLFKDSIDDEPSNKLPKPVTCTKSDELFSTYNESGANTSKANASNATDNSRCIQNLAEQSIQITPKKSNNHSNFFAYYSRSPSILIKSSSVLSAKDNNQDGQHHGNTSKTSNKSPSLLSSKLNVLNSQLSMSQLDEFDEIKENFSSPFATCKSSVVKNPSLQETDTDISEDDIFATCKPVPTNMLPPRKKKRKRKIKKWNFIDDEAGVSGDDSSDEDFIATQTADMNITEHVEEDDPSVDMQAKYLQSIRSPVKRHHFRIPNIGYRNPTATQNIFSQFVSQDKSRYEQDSFVVDSDEEDEDNEINSDCSEMCDESDESTDFDEITIVRPNKRKSDEIKQSKVKKRRRIIEMSSDSD